MNPVLQQIEKVGILPVVVLKDKKDARPLADALKKGGLFAAEVTFRTDAAADSIREMLAAYPDMLVGAGTVLTIEQARRALDAGAKFLVSPGLNPKVVSYCMREGVTFIPGINSPSGIEEALDMGYDVVKFFPAEASGGLNMLKAMSAPYGQVRFMPTGGIKASNVKEYLDHPKVIACGGSYMVSENLIDAGAFDEIERLTRQAAELVADRAK